MPSDSRTDQLAASLVELTVYGLASLYEQYVPPPKDAAKGTKDQPKVEPKAKAEPAAKDPAPAAPKGKPEATPAPK